MDIDLRVIQPTKNSGLRQTDPRAFTAGAQGLIQLGQGLQDVGDAGAKFVLAEQKLFNNTQFASSEVERKLQVADLEKRLREPGVFNPHTFEGDMKMGIANINAILAGDKSKGGVSAFGANSLLKTQIKASGESYFADNLKRIQSEGRVYRLKSLQAQGLGNVRALRQELTNTNDPLLKKGLRETIENVLEGMTDGDILDPLKAQAELDSIDKDIDEGNIRRKIATAKTYREVEAVIDASRFLSAEEKEIYKVSAERNLRMRITERNAKFDRDHKLSEWERDERYRANEANFIDRLNSNNPPTVEELDQAMKADKITSSARNSLEKEITTFTPESDRPTIRADYKSVVEKIEAGTISESDIRFHSGLSNKDRTSLVTRLVSKGAKIETTDMSQARHLMTTVVGDTAAINKYEAAAKRMAAQAGWVEFYDRVNGYNDQPKESPQDVANDIVGRWTNAESPESQVHQTRVRRVKLDMPKIYHKHFVPNADGLEVPDTAAMANQLLKEQASLSEEEFYRRSQQIKELKDYWSLEDQTKYLPPPPPIEPGEPKVEEKKLSVQEQAKEIVQPIQEQVKEVVEPIKKTLQSLKKAISDSETGPETLNRWANEGLQALGMQEEPSSTLKEPSYSREELFNTGLTAKELQDDSEWPNDFLEKKHMELSVDENLDYKEKALLQRLRQELIRRGLRKG